MFGPDSTFEYSSDLRSIYRKLTHSNPLVIFCLAEHADDIMNIVHRHSEFNFRCMKAGKPQVRAIIATGTMHTHGRVDTFPITKDLHDQVIPFTMIHSNRRISEHFHIARFYNGHTYRHKKLDYNTPQYEPELVLEMIRFAVATPDHAHQMIGMVENKLQEYIDPPLDADQLAACQRERMARLVRPNAIEPELGRKLWGEPVKISDFWK